ncbi:MAG TPA: class I SAM-dependent methyltransferase [Anaeromyxobacter sp.]|nr:class I SAM-dependent methyltransferase [Anaeromyxobacter sp.]
MKNADRWEPSKYRLRRGKLEASRDRGEVSVGSRLIADAIAAQYGTKLPRYARGRLVDLGCGKVPLYEAYRDLVTEVVCVDWANTPHQSPFLDRTVDLDGPLPWDAERFDTAILSDVLEHVQRPEHLLQEVARILSPGGRLLLNVPFLYAIHEAPHDYYRYTEFALRRMVELCGLRLVELEALGGGAQVLADLTAKLLLRFGLLGRPVAAFVQWYAGMLLRTRRGRRRAARSARRFPLGYFLVVEKPGPGAAEPSASAG